MGQIFEVFGAWGHGIEKDAIFTPKGTSLRKSTLFEPFWMKIG